MEDLLLAEAVDDRLSSRTVEISGSSAIIRGIEGEAYFNQVEHYAAQNMLFARALFSLSPDSVVIDVGAHIGATTIMAARQVPDGQVVAIEPAPTALRCLEATVAANRLDNVIVEGVALSDGQHRLGFKEADFLAGSHPTVGSFDDSRTVEATTLDDLIDRLGLPRVDLLKIDVNGFEFDVLKGAVRTLERFSPRVILAFSSFALIANRDISPKLLMDHVLDEFGHFTTWWGNDQLVTVQGGEDSRHFLYANMLTYGCTDIDFGGPGKPAPRSALFRA